MQETEALKTRGRGRCLLSRFGRPAPEPGEGLERTTEPAQSSRIEHAPQPRPDEPAEDDEVLSLEDWEPPRVVAEILSDGTVQVLDRAGEAESVASWGSGIVAGRGWTIWWERRRWA
jgi:hypothetical protein